MHTNTRINPLRRKAIRSDDLLILIQKIRGLLIECDIFESEEKERQNELYFHFEFKHAEQLRVPIGFYNQDAVHQILVAFGEEDIIFALAFSFEILDSSSPISHMKSITELTPNLELNYANRAHPETR